MIIHHISGLAANGKTHQKMFRGQTVDRCKDRLFKLFQQYIPNVSLAQVLFTGGGGGATQGKHPPSPACTHTHTKNPHPVTKYHTNSEMVWKLKWLNLLLFYGDVKAEAPIYRFRCSSVDRRKAHIMYRFVWQHTKNKVCHCAWQKYPLLYA